MAKYDPQKIYPNNTFDLEDLYSAIADIHDNSFQHLYFVQQKITQMKRFNLKFKDFKLSPELDRKYSLFVTKELIPEDERLSYRRSSFYNKEIAMQNILDNDNIFPYNFLVFINGELYDTFKILCREEFTNLIAVIEADGLTQDQFNEFYKNNAELSLIFVPNPAYGTTVEAPVVLGNHNGQINLSQFNMNVMDTVNPNTMIFSKLNNITKPNSYLTTSDYDNGVITLYNEELISLANQRVKLTHFQFPWLDSIVELSEHEKIFDIPIKEMPIPVENMMVFYNIDGKKYFANDIEIVLNYPNIYEVKNNNNNRKLSIYVFYNNDRSQALAYKNHLAVYYKFTKDVLEKYKDGTIPKLVSNYTPYKPVFGMQEMLYTIYKDDPLSYKGSRLQKWIDSHHDELRTYLYYQMMENNSYYIDCTKIDLSSRVRLDSLSEFPDTPLSQDLFNEEMYVFYVKDRFKYQFDHLTVFIDGLRFYPRYHYKKDGIYNYFYIPTRLIHQNTLLEIELFKTYSYDKTYTFNSLDDSFIVELPLNNNDPVVHLNDVYFINNDMDDKENFNRYLFKEDFEFSFKINGETIKVTDDISYKSYTIMDGPVLLKLTNPDLIGVPIKMMIRKISFTKKWNCVDQGLFKDKYKFTEETQREYRHYRLFRNGYYIPPNIFRCRYATHMGHEIVFTPYFLENVGDELVLDHTPNKYKPILYKEKIPENGYLELEQYLTAPIGFKRYELYLNGKRLNKKTCEILTPTKILIHDVESIQNFAIVEKNRDDEVFHLDGNPDGTIMDKLINFYEEVKNDIDEYYDDIIDTEPDSIGDYYDGYTYELIQFFDIFMKYMFINPDWKQVEDKYIYYFTVLFELPNFVLLLKPDICANDHLYDADAKQQLINPDFIDTSV